MQTQLENFSPITQYPLDPILGLNKISLADNNPNKVNLTIGVYKDENGKSWILPSVWEASKILLKKPNHDYLKPQGDQEFIEESLKLAYGFENGLYSGIYKNSEMVQIQSLSGTGALYLMFYFVKNFYKPLGNEKKIYLSTPFYPNHLSMLKEMNMNAGYYRYYDLEKRIFTFDLMIEDLQKIPVESAVLLHACGHNPTGFDPSKDQWKEILQICKQRKFLVLFDMAYQGFVSGSVEEDAFALRLFTKQQVPLMMCQSFAKNFGLYGQRVGTFSIPCKNEKFVNDCNEYFNGLVRRIYSNSSRYGSDIILTILKNPQLKKQWEEDIITMSRRITEMRKALYEALKKNGVKQDWSFILQQKGMFGFTPITKEQAIKLRNHSVYMLENGRISLSGLNVFNVDFVAKAIKAVIE